MKNEKKLKVALVCDWLTNVGGAEKVLLKIHQMFPEAPIYTSQYNPRGIDWFKDAEVRTGWMQKLPAGMRRFFGPWRQKYFEKLDLSGYDLVISVTGAEAKAVKVPDGVHISYCHVPTQYYWQMYENYVENPGFGVLNPIARTCLKILVKPLRKADFRAAQKVDQFVTISEYAKELIGKYYKREARVVNPPVEIDNFKIKKGNCQEKKGRTYITTSRQVNWKRIDLAVEAAKRLGRELVVIGEGPEHKNLVKLAAQDKGIKFLPLMKQEKLAQELSKADGYLFPSLEPFGIAPVEALATGCPVIAYGEGGARDYVIENKNGILFAEQTVESLMEGILKFEQIKFSRKMVAETAEKFSEARFERELRAIIKEVTRE